MDAETRYITSTKVKINNLLTKCLGKHLLVTGTIAMPSETY